MTNYEGTKIYNFVYLRNSFSFVQYTVLPSKEIPRKPRNLNLPSFVKFAVML